jgi:hypothetical protein
MIYASHKWTIGGQPIINADRDNHHLHDGQANSVFWPAGSEWIVAKLLMLRSAIDDVVSGAQTLLIEVEVPVDPDEDNWSPVADTTQTVRLENLYLVKGEPLTRSLEGEANTLYLCEFVDSRYFSKRMTSVNAYYNVRLPAPRTDDPSQQAAFAEDSLNNGEVWQWQDAFENLWSKLPLGTAPPTLPIVPDVLLDSLIFEAIPGLDALSVMLDILGLVLHYDGQNWQAVQPINVPWSGTELLIKGSNAISPVQSRLPETINVGFWKKQLHDGTQRYYHYSKNSRVDALYLESIDSESAESIAGTELTIIDDTFAMVDFESEICNVTQLHDRAVLVAEAYKSAQIDRQTLYVNGISGQVTPGESLQSVRYTENARGAITQIVSWPKIAAPRFHDIGGTIHSFGGSSGQSLNNPLDQLTKRQLEGRPENEWIMIYHDDETDIGDDVEDIAGLFPARIVRADPNEISTLDYWRYDADLESDKVWLALKKDLVTGGDVPIVMKHGEVYEGRINGFARAASETRPLFIAESCCLQIPESGCCAGYCLDSTFCDPENYLRITVDSATIHESPLSLCSGGDSWTGAQLAFGPHGSGCAATLANEQYQCTTGADSYNPILTSIRAFFHWRFWDEDTYEVAIEYQDSYGRQPSNWYTYNMPSGPKFLLHFELANFFAPYIVESQLFWFVLPGKPTNCDNIFDPMGLEITDADSDKSPCQFYCPSGLMTINQVTIDLLP